MTPNFSLARFRAAPFFVTLVFLGAAGCFVLLTVPLVVSAQEKTVWSDQEKPIVEQIRGLRKLPDDVRARTTKDLALQIRQLPVSLNKLQLAGALANLSTEGDFGHEALQEVANTLAAALREQPTAGKNGEPSDLYMELASLARYEHVSVASANPQFAAATARLEAQDAERQQADFTLSDLQGKSWRLKDLQGKVVLVNFWATWCPPCRKEMPDLQSLYIRFREQGLVVLAISDEDAAKVTPFIVERAITYPVLIDPGRKVNGLFQIEGIPKSFVYDRNGKLVAQSIDMRTQKQFLEMLAQAGLQ
ncbi:MAG: TlpA disulfide reductase family protein [Candidatus Sulfotelmatobacter sp.]